MVRRFLVFLSSEEKLRNITKIWQNVKVVSKFWTILLLLQPPFLLWMGYNCTCCVKGILGHFGIYTALQRVT